MHDYTVFVALRPEMLGMARAILRGSNVRTDPEDLVQTVLAKILAAIQAGTLPVIESPRHFAYRALKNQFLDDVRRLAHSNELLARDGEQVDTADRGALQSIGNVELRQVLEKLTEQERCFVLNALIEERSVFDAQRHCGWPPRSPYYHLRLLLAKMRELLAVPTPEVG
jgi:RNA polymerase sigma factor (sigma-70 family)